MVIGIDGAFVKAGRTRADQRHQFEILTGRVEASQRGGEAFAVVRDLDPYAKRRVQAILRRCGHRLDWFHVARRIARKSAEIVLDFDGTDDPFHGSQEGAFFNGYYRHYCYLPL